MGFKILETPTGYAFTHSSMVGAKRGCSLLAIAIFIEVCSYATRTGLLDPCLVVSSYKIHVCLHASAKNLPNPFDTQHIQDMQYNPSFA